MKLWQNCLLHKIWNWLLNEFYDEISEKHNPSRQIVCGIKENIALKAWWHGKKDSIASKSSDSRVLEAVLRVNSCLEAENFQKLWVHRRWSALRENLIFRK